MGDLAVVIKARDPPSWSDEAARSAWASAARSYIAEVVARDADGESRPWLLWRMAMQCKEVGMFSIANDALDATDNVITEREWTPVWAAEFSLLRMSLLQDGAEEAQALSWVARTMYAWLNIGRWLFAEAKRDDVLAVVRGAQQMYVALVGPERLTAVATAAALPPSEATLAVWLSDRWAESFREAVARTSALIAIDSYEHAKSFLGDVLAEERRWALVGKVAGVDLAVLEAGIQLALSACAARTDRRREGLAHAEAGLRMLTEVPPGRNRDETEAELRVNRANDLIVLGETAAAQSEYAAAEPIFINLGRTGAALRCRHGILATRYLSGDPVDLDKVRRLISDYEAVIDTATRPDGDIFGDVELARRLLLSEIAAGADGEDASEAIELLEVLRDDRPMLRAGASLPDPVISRLCAPLGVAATRLAALRDTVVIVHEPGLDGPVFLVLRADGDRAPIEPGLIAGNQETEIALTELAHRAQTERERLIAQEIPLQGAASRLLTDAAERAWAALPAELCDAITGARTILYMPSALGSPSRAHLELLRADGEWLGTTRVLARCPSLVYLNTLLAPNRVAWLRDDSASVVEALPSDQLGALAAARADADTALNATRVLGLAGGRREISSVEDAVAALTSGRILHYVGHGFASDVGELLPLSPSVNLPPVAIERAPIGPRPFVFFSACSLAHTRHVSGGRQRGWALAMLLHGAPAVLGSLFTVPDDLCPIMTEAFYRGAWKSPVGEGLRRARAELHEASINPAAWASFVLLGDPNTVISNRLDGPQDTPEIVARWPSLLARHLATGDSRYRSELAHALAADAGLSDAPAAKLVLERWPDLERSDTDDLVATAIEELLDQDIDGAAMLRITQALQRADSVPDDDTGSSVQDELDDAWLAAEALDDGYAKLLVAAKYLAHWDPTRPESLRAALREAASACLEELPRDSVALRPLVHGLGG